MKIVIEGEEMKNIKELHSFLKRTLEFPDYYGMNLDALWDMLTSWVDFPLSIEWKDHDISERKIGSAAIKIMEFFEEAEAEINDFSVNKLV